MTLNHFIPKLVTGLIQVALAYAALAIFKPEIPEIPDIPSNLLIGGAVVLLVISMIGSFVEGFMQGLCDDLFKTKPASKRN